MTTLLLALLVLAGDSTVYPVYNHGRVAGSMVVAQHGDSIVTRYVFTDRNRGTRLELRYLMRGDSVRAVETRPVLAGGRSGDPVARLTFDGDSVRRWTPAGTYARPVERDAFYQLGGTPYEEVRLARYLLRRPTHAGRIAGGLPARLDVVRQATVPTAHGKARVRMLAVTTGGSTTPQVLWVDGRDDLFATQVGWFITVQPGAEPALPELRTIETAYRDSSAKALNAALVRSTGGTLAIVNGALFDADAGVVRPRMTVIVRGDRIDAVGPSDSLRAPAGAAVIDAAGKTVMPGLWEMHNHMQLISETLGGPMQLAAGITTARDMASDIDVAVAERARADSGLIAAPRDVLSGFMEGPGAWAGPTSVIVRTEDEARAWVARYDSLGYKQIKLYNLIHPDLVPTIAAEAHKRGMRLSGHIPRGLSVPAAVLLGFDEIQHAAFLFSTFYQDSLYVPTMRAYSLVASIVAPTIDVDGPQMTQLIGFLKEHHTVIDGTFNVWVRSANTGLAQAVGAGASSDAAKADANYLRLLKRLYDAGVTLVAGTDAFGSSTYDTELELYQRAGLPAPAVLQIATIGSARVMHQDAEYGSIAPGKIADIIIVNGNPAADVSALRKVETTVRAGRVYDVAAIRTALGMR